MNIASIQSGMGATLGTPEATLGPNGSSKPGAPARDPGEVARQFEAILVRQMLSESMKTLVEGSEGQHAYGYFISEALSDGITRGGGLGLRSVLESQLRGAGEALQAAEQRKASLPDVSEK
jgi:Rod binding domain-containing protein